MTPCLWACCPLPAVTTVDGWPSCGSPDHHTHAADNNTRPCTACGESFTSRTVQAKTCPDCRADRKHQRAPEHGTRHGYQKHRAAGQPPCDDCTTAQADYDRARYQQRKSA